MRHLFLRWLCLLMVLCGALSWSPAAPPDRKITQHLPAAEEKQHFVLPPDFEIELVAAEPLVINPVTMTLDDKGRLYVSESHTYRYGPSGSPVKPFGNPIVRLDPLPDGTGYKRVVVVDGLEEPAMGLAIRQGKLWVTANNYLFQYDLPAGGDGKATNKRTLLTDKNKAWNPFGMFVLEWGPDGLLYMSVGNHNIDIGGPTNRIGGRGSSGIIVRMKPDGSDLERLTHGLRVPYSFEYDPFGQLWLLSNGEGNPDRFVRVIDGVDYHCFSRPGVSNDWLAGRHPLAPPCFELHRGAHTQLIRYYGAAWPAAYSGSLLLDNWGAHGFNGPNRAIFRFVPDDMGNIVTKESFVSCTDPHFRPSHILLDPDGNLLIADWYGRDDESDLTGRIWRVKYTGKNRPSVEHKLDTVKWLEDSGHYALSALGSPHHLIREKAVEELIRRGNQVVPGLSEKAANALEPLGAANALWTLLRIGTPESQVAIAAGAKHSDWHVRRLTLKLLRRYRLPGAAEVAQQLLDDGSSAVRLEAALTLPKPDRIAEALLDVLRHGAARDVHLRYEAAWHLAHHAGAATFKHLLQQSSEEERLAGLIALDVACFEDLPSKPAALEVLAGALEKPGKLDPELLLTLAQLNGDKVVLAVLEKLVVRPDLPAAVTARALLVLRSRAGGVAKDVIAAAGKRFLEAVEQGSVRLTSASDQMLLLQLLEAEGPTPFTVKQLGGILAGRHPVRSAALDLARKFGPAAAPLANTLWPAALDGKAKVEERIEVLGTLARIEAQPSKARWEQLLADPSLPVRTEALRDWRAFKDQPDLVAALVGRAPGLMEKDAGLADDLGAVLRHLGDADGTVKKLGLPEPATDKDRLAQQTTAGLAKLAPTDRPARAALGRQVFERTGCVKCHTTVTENTPLAPSLKGIATAQKIDYLIESVLYPSKIIKTGYETERIETKNGKVVTGLVKDEGDTLRILQADAELRIKKKDVEERSIQKVSLMPDGQEKLLSREEFLDLIAYLQTLR